MEIVSDKEWQAELKWKIDNHYMKSDGTPLKCHHCDSRNLISKNNFFEDYQLVERDICCNSCNRIIGHWGYGSWEMA